MTNCSWGRGDSPGWAVHTCPSPTLTILQPGGGEARPGSGSLTAPLQTWKMRDAKERLAVALREAGLSREAERVWSQNRHLEQF